MMNNDLNSEEQVRQVRKAYREAVRETVRGQAHDAAHDAVNDEPPASIDDAIRAAARRAVAAKPQPLQKKWHQRWGTPLAAAATVLLTSSIIFVAMEEHPTVITEPLGDAARVARIEMSAPPTVASLPAPIPAPALEPAAPASAAAPVAAKKSAMPLANDVDSRRQKSDTVATTQAMIAQLKANNAPRADVADSALDKKAVADASEPPAKAAGRTQLHRAESAPVITNLMSVPPNKPAKEAPAYVVPAVASAVAPAAPSTPAFAPPPAPQPPPALVSAAPNTAASSTTATAKPTPNSDKIERITVTGSSIKSSDAGKLAEIVAPTIVTPAAAPIAANAVGKLEKSETAEAWIARMKDLKAQHKNSGPNELLQDELTRFRKRYPNVTLPESLAEEWAKIERAKVLPP